MHVYEFHLGVDDTNANYEHLRAYKSKASKLFPYDFENDVVGDQSLIKHYKLTPLCPECSSFYFKHVQ